MPVHFNSIINEYDNDSINLKSLLLAGIIENDLDNADNVYGSKNKKKFTATKYIIDNDNNEKIGKSVITIMVNHKKKINEILDIDLTLLNESYVQLFFDEKLIESTEANEYYDVHTIDNEVHFQIETVNRCTVEEENIVDTIQKVYLSAFPFKLSIFNTIDDFNKEYGFAKPIKIRDTELEVHGYSEEMVGVGGFFTENMDEICSFIIGKIISFDDINAIIGGIKLSFTIIRIRTAFGIIPVAASRDVFDLSNMSKGKVLAMLADIKADFIK